MTDQDLHNHANKIILFWWIICPLFFVFSVAFLLAKVIFAPSLVETCFIKYIDLEKSEQKYYLYGRIPWRTDLLIVQETSFDKAKEKAEAINCEIH